MRRFGTDTGRTGSLYVSADVRKRLAAGEGVRVEEIWPSLFASDMKIRDEQRKREEKRKREIESRIDAEIKAMGDAIDAKLKPIIQRGDAVQVLVVKDSWVEYHDQMGWTAEAVETLFGARPTEQEVQQARSTLKAIRETAKDTAPVVGYWEKKHLEALESLNHAYDRANPPKEKKKLWLKKKTST